MKRRTRFLLIYLLIGVVWCIVRDVSGNMRGVPYRVGTIFSKNVTAKQRLFVFGVSVALPVFAWPLDWILLASVAPPLGKKLTLGIYATAVEAAYAYDEMAGDHHGSYASVNFPRD